MKGNDSADQGNTKHSISIHKIQINAVALTPWGTGARAPTFTNKRARGRRE